MYSASDTEVLYKIINFIASNDVKIYASNNDIASVVLHRPKIPHELLLQLSRDAHEHFEKVYNSVLSEYLTCEGGDFLDKFRYKPFIADITIKDMQATLDEVAQSRKFRNENQLWQLTANKLGLKSALFYPLEPKNAIDNQIKN